jgi:hypothetical protein
MKLNLVRNAFFLFIRGPEKYTCCWSILDVLRLKKLFRGARASSLELLLAKNQQDIGKLFTRQTEIDSKLVSLDNRMQKKIGTARTLRFNPFQGTGAGGNQSFATALLDESGNGVVLSTLYSREKLSIFAKPIKNNASEYELTEEETRVLKDEQSA